LNHPYLAIWHDPQDEPECQVKFDFKSFETVDDMAEMKLLIIEEVKNFREFVRKPIHEQQQIQLQVQIQQRQKEEEEAAAEAQRKEQQLLQQQQRLQDEMNAMDIVAATPMQQPQYEMLHSAGGASSNAHLMHSHAPVNTNPGDFANNPDVQYYQQVPKPQELDEFAFSHGNDDENTDNNNNNSNNNPVSADLYSAQSLQYLNNQGEPFEGQQLALDLFRLEEELGFGLDGNLFNTNFQ